MSSNNKSVYLVGYASGRAASDAGCSQGPLVLEKSPHMSALSSQGLSMQWVNMIEASHYQSEKSTLNAVAEQCKDLATSVRELAHNQQAFTVIGGDHSSAIGTWSGVASAYEDKGSIGLIWVDAHMDSHTQATSETGNIHGMPLACLLGHGYSDLTHICSEKPKLKPEHLCLIGIRSFESGEAALLKDLNVRIFFIDEVKERGLQSVMEEALAIVTKGTVGYGVSIDLDSIDPSEAPGTGVAEANGLSAKNLCDAIRNTIAGDQRLIGTEIVEFDPHLDKDQATEKLVPALISSLFNYDQGR